jgi:predicted DNA-binding transcriptional regulator AlpA
MPITTEALPMKLKELLAELLRNREIGESTLNLTELFDELLDNRAAARHLRLSPKTLNNSRSTGRLCGVRAPPFKKIGKSVRYERAALDDWLAQFKDQSSTAGY